MLQDPMIQVWLERRNTVLVLKSNIKSTYMFEKILPMS